MADSESSSPWNDDVTASDFAEAGQRAYQEAVLTQYLKYVDSAERVSDRRATANTFFLTLNTGIVTAVGFLWKDQPAIEQPIVLVLPLVAALALCATWYLIITAHRQLNGAKWAVIGEVEDRLPLQLWSRAEWQGRLGGGADQRRYFKLSVAEQFVPLVFALVYVLAFVLALVL